MALYTIATWARHPLDGVLPYQAWNTSYRLPSVQGDNAMRAPSATAMTAAQSGNRRPETEWGWHSGRAPTAATASAAHAMSRRSAAIRAHVGAGPGRDVSDDFSKPPYQPTTNSEGKPPQRRINGVEERTALVPPEVADFPRAARQLDHSLRQVRIALDQAAVELQHARASYATVVRVLRQTDHRDHMERPAPRLTRREYEVALLATRGASDAQIAAAAGVSVHTVKTQMKTVLSKLAIHSRWQLTEFISTYRSELT